MIAVQPSFTDDQHQRGRMVTAILADLRIVAARMFPPSDQRPAVGAPVASPLPCATGASLFDAFHLPEVHQP